MPDWLVQLAGPVLAAVGVYAGIRVDLAISKERAAAAMTSATRAHERIDILTQARR